MPCFKEQSAESTKNKEINAKLTRDNQKQKSELKLLLLGAGKFSLVSCDIFLSVSSILFVNDCE